MPFDQALAQGGGKISTNQFAAFCKSAGMIDSWFEMDGGNAKIDLWLLSNW